MNAQTVIEMSRNHNIDKGEAARRLSIITTVYGEFIDSAVSDSRMLNIMNGEVEAVEAVSNGVYAALCYNYYGEDFQPHFLMALIMVMMNKIQNQL